MGTWVGVTFWSMVGVTYRTVGHLQAAPSLKEAPPTSALTDPFVCSLRGPGQCPLTSSRRDYDGPILAGSWWVILAALIER